MITFASPAYFLLLLLIIPLIAWRYLLRRRRSEPSLTMAGAESLIRCGRTWRTRLIELPFWLRLLTFVLIVFILARPQTNEALTSSETEGIDIMMAVDISTSMLTPDISPNRIEAAKRVACEFIANRPNDNIGLTLFGGEAFTQCPLTTDHTALLTMFQAVTCDLQAAGVISPGTAIGMGLASAINRLEASPSKSKIIILLTDGENNAGEISPLTATEIAKKKEIRVYTIAIGAQGRTKQAVARLPNGEVYEEEVDNAGDPETLRTIANATGGIFYQAHNRNELRDIYQNIDRLEKTKLRTQNYNKRYEAYQPFCLAAVLCLILELLLRQTWLRRIPA